MLLEERRSLFVFSLLKEFTLRCVTNGQEKYSHNMHETIKRPSVMMWKTLTSGFSTSSCVRKWSSAASVTWCRRLWYFLQQSGNPIPHWVRDMRGMSSCHTKSAAISPTTMIKYPPIWTHDCSQPGRFQDHSAVSSMLRRLGESFSWVSGFLWMDTTAS